MAKSRSQNLPLVIALVVALLALFVNWRLIEGHSQRQTLNRGLETEDVPPTLTLITIAVGPLRGLIADVLWWRAIEMQDRGNFFESIQLATWISKLQPTMARVWTYHGWNLSSNVLNEVHEPEERWKWVLKGIELLRDEGLRYNPGNSEIRSELAHIFSNRIGSDNDPHHRYYKRQWVTLMLQYLEQGDREELLAIGRAPARVEELREAPGVADLLETAAQAGLELLDPFTYHNRELWTADQRRVLDDTRFAEAARTLQFFHARLGLEQELKMELPRMVLIDHLYGPLDWRLWQAQTIYWATAEGWGEELGIDDDFYHYHSSYMSTSREDIFIRQAMESAFQEGSFVYMNDERLMTSNNVLIIGKLDEFVHHTFEKAGSPTGARNFMRSFHENATLVLYNYMYEEEAREMYEALYEEYMTPEEREGMTFERFLIEQANRMVVGRAVQDKEDLIVSLLFQSYLWLALGEGYKAKGYENFARITWVRHQRTMKAEERQLPPFGDLQRVALDLALGPTSPLSEDVQERLRVLRGDSPGLQITPPSGERPSIGLGVHEHQH